MREYPTAVVADVSPPLPSGQPRAGYRVKIGTEARFTAGEEIPGTAIPAFCPERHLNGDKTFCLGLERYDLSRAGAEEFWEKLRAYLLCQQYADIHGRWPRGRWLSHGDAAYSQLDAEVAARSAGLSRTYRRALEFGGGRLAGDLSQLESRLGEDNDGDRPTRLALRALVKAEIRRRHLDAEFLRWSKLMGQPCCGTMRSCPLRPESEQKREPIPQKMRE